MEYGNVAQRAVNARFPSGPMFSKAEPTAQRRLAESNQPVKVSPDFVGTGK